MYVARGEILAIGAQLPYDLGIAEAETPEEAVRVALRGLADG